MGIRNWLSNLWGHGSAAIEPLEINPATSLPMIEGICGLDVAGNPYGTDLGSIADALPHSHGFDEVFSHDCHGSGFSDW